MGAVGFFAASGAESSLAAGKSRQQIWDLIAGGSSNTPSRAGFFGAAGHGTSVLLDHYNDSVFVVDKNGALWGSGQLVPMQYVSAGVVRVSGCPAGTGWNWNINQAHRVPCESGTLLIRFTEPTGGAVQTLNATFRSVALTAADVVTDDTAGADSTKVLVQAFEPSRFGFIYGGMDGNSLSGYEGDTAWEQIDDAGVDNQLALWDHPWTAPIHDFVVVVSVSPKTTGAITTFGFMVILDYV